jgi:hypothetical protein
VNTDLFPREFVPELNTKKLGNSPSFLTITHMTLSARWFRSYGRIGVEWNVTPKDTSKDITEFAKAVSLTFGTFSLP